jgi:hypothetical protein
VSKDKKAKRKAKAGQKNDEPGLSDEGTLIVLAEGEGEAEQDGASEAGLPAIFTPQLESEYSAAFSDEIVNAAFIQQAFLRSLRRARCFPTAGACA